MTQVVGADPLDHLAAGVLLGAPDSRRGPAGRRGGAAEHRLGRLPASVRRLADRAARAAAAALLVGHVADGGDAAEVPPALDLDDHRLPDPERSLAVAQMK